MDVRPRTRGRQSAWSLIDRRVRHLHRFRHYPQSIPCFQQLVRPADRDDDCQCRPTIRDESDLFSVARQILPRVMTLSPTQSRDWNARGRGNPPTRKPENDSGRRRLASRLSLRLGVRTAAAPTIGSPSPLVAAASKNRRRPTKRKAALSSALEASPRGPSSCSSRALQASAMTMAHA
jgi:hypothetical protein